MLVLVRVRIFRVGRRKALWRLVEDRRVRFVYCKACRWHGKVHSLRFDYRKADSRLVEDREVNRKACRKVVKVRRVNFGHCKSCMGYAVIRRGMWSFVDSV